MSSWNELTVDVMNDVSLDPRNVRLEVADGAPEVDLILDMFVNEHALKLVEGIARIGYLTHEFPIVVRRDERLIVVEGNRRLAALKAIQNPNLVPTFQARIAQFVDRIDDRDELRFISVKEAPTQDDADQLIATLHTSNQRFSWSPIRQAAFFQAQVDAGKTTRELIERYPMIDVKRYVARAQVLNLFRGVEYRDAALKDFVSRRRFPVSTLARLYENDEFLLLIGIDLNEQSGLAKLRAKRSTFRLLAEKVVGDIKRNHINTRVLNKPDSPSYREYMDELRALLDEIRDREATKQDSKKKPDESNDLDDSAPSSRADDITSPENEGGGSRPQSAGTAAGGDQSQPGEEGRSKDEPGATTTSGADESDPSHGTLSTKAEPKPARLNFLSVRNVQVHPGRPAAIHAIVAEVGALNIERFPNSALDLIRTLFEKSAKAYADSMSVDIRSEISIRGPYVYFNHCLEWLEGHFKKDQSKRRFVQVIQKIRSNRANPYAARADHLNAINHNHLIIATPDEVRETWVLMEPVLQEIVV